MSEPIPFVLPKLEKPEEQINRLAEQLGELAGGDFGYVLLARYKSSDKAYAVIHNNFMHREDEQELIEDALNQY